MGDVLSSNLLEDVNKVFGENGLMSQMFDNYKIREEQIKAIPIVWDCFENNKHCILEGPCGFGKSFAYLFPAIMEVATKGKRVVIATSGITLQQQLYEKDIPFMVDIVEEFTGNDVKYASLKGRQNYVCKVKLATEKELGKINGLTISMKKLIAHFDKSKVGDKDELDFVPNLEEWGKISSSSHDCAGRNCPFYSKCFYQTAKAKAFSAGVVVVNYHLLLSDDLVRNSVLGTKDILICDEAHEIADIAREFLCKTLSMRVLVDIEKDLNKLLDNFSDVVVDYNLPGNMESCKINFNQYETNILMGVSINKGETLNINNYNENLVINDFIFSLKESIDIFKGNMNELLCGASDLDYMSQDNVNIFKTMCSNICEKLNSVGEVISSFISNDKENDVRYIELSKFDKIALKVKQKKINKYFQNRFIDKQNDDILPTSILFTSATLSVAGSFNYIKEELGITEEYKVEEFIGSSPFDLTKQELWYLPSEAVNGNERDFTSVMLPIFNNVIKECSGGVLGLFTSVSSMNKAYDYVSRRGYSMDIYKQGVMPRNVLIETFKENENSVLIGTKSMFTGIDVPGNSLRCVFIDKLPFPNISDPVVKALNEEPGAFFKYSIPAMVIALKQAVGRGVRTTEDKCVICIADNRLSTARYKAQIFQSFNYKKTGTRDLEEIRKFLGGR